MANPELTDSLKSLVTMSSLPLKAAESDFAVDSSGISTSRFVRWYNKKYGREVDNRVWVKVHLMCGVHTKIVSSVEVSGWTVHDTNYFVPLVEATAEHFKLRDVSADKASPGYPCEDGQFEPAGSSRWIRSGALSAVNLS
jgi:hypothetical protein